MPNELWSLWTYFFSLPYFFITLCKNPDWNGLITGRTRISWTWGGGGGRGQSPTYDKGSFWQKHTIFPLTIAPPSFWHQERYYCILKQECIQSKANCPLCDRNPNTYNLILQWPWLQHHHDLDLELVSNSPRSPFYQSDLDLDPMTLILKVDLDVVKMYHHTKIEVSMSRYSKVKGCTDRQTDTQTVWKHYLSAYGGSIYTLASFKTTLFDQEDTQHEAK